MNPFSPALQGQRCRTNPRQPSTDGQRRRSSRSRRRRPLEYIATHNHPNQPTNKRGVTPFPSGSGAPDKLHQSPSPGMQKWKAKATLDTTPGPATASSPTPPGNDQGCDLPASRAWIKRRRMTSPTPPLPPPARRRHHCWSARAHPTLPALNGRRISHEDPARPRVPGSEALGLHGHPESSGLRTVLAPCLHGREFSRTASTCQIAIYRFHTQSTPIPASTHVEEVAV